MITAAFSAIAKVVEYVFYEQIASGTDNRLSVVTQKAPTAATLLGAIDRSVRQLSNDYRLGTEPTSSHLQL